MIEIKDYPKSKEKLDVFVKDLMTKLQKDLVAKLIKEIPELAEDFATAGEAEIKDERVDETVKGILTENPRCLYDFFDKEGIYIGVAKGVDHFYGNVDAKEFIGTDRAEVEMKVFEQAFKILEEEL